MTANYIYKDFQQYPLGYSCTHTRNSCKYTMHTGVTDFRCCPKGQGKCGEKHPDIVVRMSPVGLPTWEFITLTPVLTEIEIYREPETRTSQISDKSDSRDRTHINPPHDLMSTQHPLIRPWKSTPYQTSGQYYPDTHIHTCQPTSYQPNTHVQSPTTQKR